MYLCSLCLLTKTLNHVNYLTQSTYIKRTHSDGFFFMWKLVLTVFFYFFAHSRFSVILPWLEYILPDGIERKPVLAIWLGCQHWLPSATLGPVPESPLNGCRCWLSRALPTTLSFLPGLYGSPYSLTAPHCISSRRGLGCLWVSFRMLYTCKSGAVFFSSPYIVLREISKAYLVI